MTSFVLSLELIFPMIFYMMLGFILKRWLDLKEQTLWEMNRLVFSVFLPTFLFVSISASDFKQGFDLKVLIYVFLSMISIMLISIFLIPKVEPIKTNQSVMIQGIYRSNYALFGMSMTRLLYGDDNLGMAGIIAALLMPLFSFVAVLLFETFRGGKVDKKSTVKNIVTNPLIISSLLGVAFSLLSIELPGFVTKSLETLGNMATPIALIVIGAIFSLNNVKKYVKQLSIVTLFKLVIVPIIFISIARLLNISGVNLYVLMTVYASPTAVASFTMATELGGNQDLAGLIVAVTSVCSLLTFFLWTFLFIQMGWA